MDILDRLAGPDGSDVVYQVKRSTKGLNQNQKDTIEGSLVSLKSDERWKSLRVLEWHLVTPWDPSPEAENWLQELGREYGLIAIWNGHSFVEQLAAKYQDVVDYYLHGGRALIEQAFEKFAALLGVDQGGEGLSVPLVVDRIQKALGTLEHDPHHRFELRFGEGEPPPPQTRPFLVMSCMTYHSNQGNWAIVDIIARCAASCDERPIKIRGTLAIEPDSGFAHTFNDFATFGTRFKAHLAHSRG